jgi:hypothetical protein
MNARHAALAAVALLVCSCKTGPTQEEIDTAKQTVDCLLGDERIVIRRTEGEARLLMPDGARVILYQVTASGGPRYTNGVMDVRGSGLELTLVRDGTASPLTCKPYEIPIPKKE